jgi:hypothetical protein
MGVIMKTKALDQHPVKSDAQTPIDMSRIEVRSEPYPHFLLDDAVEPAMFDQMSVDWPIDLFDHRPERMGGRVSFNQKTTELKVLMERSIAWKRFFAFINSKEFVDAILKLYRPYFEGSGFALNPDDLEFSPAFNERVKDSTVTVDYGLTRARTGYSCKVHHDQEFRIGALLLFMNDRSEFGGSGGTFNVHRMVNSNPINVMPRFPKQDIELVEIIEPRKNRLVSFMNSRSAYHSVPEMTDCHGWRNFLYLGINAGNKESRVWL